LDAATLAELAATYVPSSSDDDAPMVRPSTAFLDDGERSSLSPLERSSDDECSFGDDSDDVSSSEEDGGDGAGAGQRAQWRNAPLRRAWHRAEDSDVAPRYVARRGAWGCRHWSLGLCSAISALLLAYVSLVMKTPTDRSRDAALDSFFGKIRRDVDGMSDGERWNTLATELTLLYTQQTSEILGLPRASLARLAEIQANSGAYEYLLANDIVCACDKPDADTIKNALLIDLEMETGTPVAELQLLNSRELDEKALRELAVPFAYALPKLGDASAFDTAPIVALVERIQQSIDRGEYAHKQKTQSAAERLAARMVQRGG
jgi:hypothetical protein